LYFSAVYVGLVKAIVSSLWAWYSLANCSFFRNCAYFMANKTVIWAASLKSCRLLWQPVAVSIYRYRRRFFVYFVYCTVTNSGVPNGGLGG